MRRPSADAPRTSTSNSRSPFIFQTFARKGLKPLPGHAKSLLVSVFTFQTFFFSLHYISSNCWGCFFGRLREALEQLSFGFLLLPLYSPPLTSPPPVKSVWPSSSHEILITSPPSLIDGHRSRSGAVEMTEVTERNGDKRNEQNRLINSMNVKASFALNPTPTQPHSGPL